MNTFPTHLVCLAVNIVWELPRVLQCIDAVQNNIDPLQIKSIGHEDSGIVRRAEAK